MVTKVESAFRFLMMLQLGTTQNLDSLARDLDAIGCNPLGSSCLPGNDLVKLCELELAPKVTEIELFVVPVRKLGFEIRAPLGEIHSRIIELGHDLCPAEAGPQLSKQHKNQPRGQRLHVAMKSVYNPNRDNIAFCVGCEDDGTLRLYSYGGYPTNYHGADTLFVVTRRLLVS